MALTRPQHDLQSLPLLDDMSPVGLTLRERNVAISVAVQDHPATSGIGDENRGITKCVPVGDVLGASAHQRVDGTIAEVFIAGLRKADDRSMQDDRVEGWQYSP